MSLILGTQELADLKSVGDGSLREQTLGNVETVIAHRQNVPESAELLSDGGHEGGVGDHPADGEGVDDRGPEWQGYPPAGL